MSASRPYLRVLGPMTAEFAGLPRLDLGGPKQRAVLALLMVERGGVVSVDRLIDDLWRGEPPPRATGALQAYVSNLRRVLEPDRPPRAPATILVSAPPGYAVRLPPSAVDAWQFEVLLRESVDAEPAAARHRLEQALALWRGPAYAEVADEPWAQAEAARLEELRVAARERLVETLLACGAPGDAVPQAQALTREHPLREEGWRLLAIGLYASARQGEALAVLRQARAVIAEELGLDPGPALVQLEQDLLAQRVATVTRLPVPGRRTEPNAELTAGGPPDGEEAQNPPEETGFVGRGAELLSAHESAVAARRGALKIMLVSGEPGAGKSALLEQIRQGLVRAQWLTAVGRCPEVDGAPPAWPWAHMLRQVTAAAGDVLDEGLIRDLAALLQDGQTGDGDVTSGRFRLHRAVAECLVRLRRPVLLILDDLHRADAETLAILRSVSDLLTSELGSVEGVLLVAAYRTGEGGEQLEETLAELARYSPARLHLQGLDGADAARFVRQQSGMDPDDATLAALVERTGGNPFYLRESARLLASEGELVATSEVPEGVADVLRRRLARLPERDVVILRLAAVQGRDVDLDVLIDAARPKPADSTGAPGADEGAVLSALEAGLLAGLLTELDDGGVRFTHVLIQETLLRDLPRLRRTRLHARVGAAIERLRPHDHAALAYHYAQARSPSTAARAISACVAAAAVASSRYAHDAAAALYQQAIDCAGLLAAGHPAASDDARAQLYGGLVTAQLWSGNAIAANENLRHGLDLAQRNHRDDLAIDLLAAADVPLAWLTRPYDQPDTRKIALLRRLLRRDDLSAPTRCQLLCVLVREDGPDDGDAIRPQALEAVELARGIGDPGQLCHALGALAGVVSSELEPALKGEIAQEMVELGSRHDLPAAQVLGHYNLVQYAGAMLDLPLLRQHLEQAAALAERYQLVQSMDTCLMTRAVLEHVAGRLAEAEQHYLAVTTLIRQHGSPDADGMAGLALFTIRRTQGREAELAPILQQLQPVVGPAIADMLALALSAAGQHEGAAAAYRAGVWPRPDFFQVLRATVRAAAAVATGAREDAARFAEFLRPFAGLIAGLGTGAFAAGPVAQVLGDLSRMLGHEDDARAYYRQAAQVAALAGAPVWGVAALAAQRDLDRPA